jgi:uncharacterized protein YbcV (DUF1398 family)
MMSTHEQIIQDTFVASNEGRIHFGEVISRMIEAGVESYQADFRSRQTIYRLNNDETIVLNLAQLEQTIAEDFSATGIVAAIKGAQQGVVMYPEFKRLSMQAGCIGYSVWIKGRHVSYYGRKGETHNEYFPN